MFLGIANSIWIIAGLLVANQKVFADNASPLHFMYLPDMKELPIWIILSAHAAIGLGTLTGGWRIMRTMGTRAGRRRACRARPRRASGRW